MTLIARLNEVQQEQVECSVTINYNKWISLIF